MGVGSVATICRSSIEAGESRTIEGKGGPATLSAFIVQHGNIPALGYRIGDTACTPEPYPSEPFSRYHAIP